MQCPRCQHVVPADADFCPACGARLALICTHCAAENSPGSGFCKKCGQPLGGDARAARSYTPAHLAA